MQFIQEKVKLNNVIDRFSGQNLLDVNTTITRSLEKSELHIYSRAIGKVLNKATLSRDDLKVLDKIDALTYEKHGMCLKDSAVTKARLKACKKYGMQFIDRDGLVIHLQMMINLNQEKTAAHKFGAYITDKLGAGSIEAFYKAMHKVKQGIDLDIADLKTFNAIEEVAEKKFNWCMRNEKVQIARKNASEKLGMKFLDLSKVIFH
ncbi:hypothetical protein ICU98_06845 [Polynucleobacter sp. MWH-P3-07-1]|uniref:hypothetical protein n=1 Tax=Polynucleobacter sp. MWH-P3-07-1 TaxID=1743173 RepID=UPI001BFD11B7|nr:hypothetical protein [Polynucleobacter sp. MWH-P3-07-1]QWD83146.1 hypothetical protein ICU98_06845 [Polynucleobacter sp. MWH-P3-07-1]